MINPSLRRVEGPRGGGAGSCTRAAEHATGCSLASLLTSLRGVGGISGEKGAAWPLGGVRGTRWVPVPGVRPWNEAVHRWSSARKRRILPAKAVEPWRCLHGPGKNVGHSRGGSRRAALESQTHHLRTQKHPNATAGNKLQPQQAFVYRYNAFIT